MSAVTTRKKALEQGISLAAQRHRLARGDWQRVFPGVFVTHNARVSWRERAEAAVLARGEGALVSLSCALHLWGLSDQQPQIITIAEPADTHRRRALPGVRPRRRRRLVRATRYGIPVTGLAQTVLDVVALPHTTPDEIVSLVTRALRTGKLTVDNLLRELDHRPRHPHRAFLTDILLAASDGLASAAEVRYVRDVETAHGLPRMERQVPLDGPAAVLDGRSRRLDFRDAATGLSVEVDGELYHRDRKQEDRARDRQVAGRGEVVLRAGWSEVVGAPCALAADVGVALRARGWPGSPRPCSKGCAVAADPRLRPAN